MQGNSRPPQRVYGNLCQHQILMSHIKIIVIDTVSFHRFVLKISIHTPCEYFWGFRGGWRLRTAVSAWHWKAPPCAETRRWHSACEHWSTGKIWNEHDEVGKKRHNSIMSPFIGQKVQIGILRGSHIAIPIHRPNRKFGVGEYTYDVTLNEFVIPAGQGMSNLTGYGILYCFRSEWKMKHDSEAMMCSSRQISQWSLHRVAPAERETASTTKFRGCPNPPQINCKLDQILNLMCTQTKPSLIATRFDTWE